MLSGGFPFGAPTRVNDDGQDHLASSTCLDPDTIASVDFIDHGRGYSSRKFAPDGTARSLTASAPLEGTAEPARPISLARFQSSAADVPTGALEIDATDVNPAAFALSLPRTQASDGRLLNALLQAARRAVLAARDMA